MPDLKTSCSVQRRRPDRGPDSDALPGPVTTIRQFALKQSRTLLGELRKHLAEAVSTGEAESIHQTRRRYGAGSRRQRR
jgi:hypothetical protein